MANECISSVKDIVVALSAAGAAFIAYQGLSTWQKELKGKSEYQLAKDVLRSVYKVREAFKYVRNPIYEYPKDMTDQTGHLKDEFSYKGMAHVYGERWKKLDEAFSELEEKYLEALVEWGSEYENTIVPLRKCQSDLFIDIQYMLAHQEKLKRLEGVEKRSTEINSAIELFEKWLRPYVSRKRKKV